MCVSCNCGDLNNDHGDPRNITLSQIQQAASAAGTSPRQVGENIQRGVQQS